ncbi:MAG: hypothetical protein HY553_22185 [Elusimicrobia bacterium]|nr:hypothetical protein [Elusimicrobiota bacterium]
MEGCARALFLELAEENRIGPRRRGLSASWLRERARAHQPPPPRSEPNHGGGSGASPPPRERPSDPCVYWDPDYGGWVRRSPCP